MADSSMENASRDTARGPVVVRCRGREWNILPDRFTLKVGIPLEKGELTATLRALLGEEQLDALAELDVDYREGWDLVKEAIAGLSGASLGEAPASSNSSESTGTRPKPTSSGSTGSTSLKAVSGETR